MKCPNCNNEVKEDDLMPSILTNSLLCCPRCKGENRHVAIYGDDPTLTFGQAEALTNKKKK